MIKKSWNWIWKHESKLAFAITIICFFNAIAGLYLGRPSWLAWLMAGLAWMLLWSKGYDEMDKSKPQPKGINFYEGTQRACKAYVDFIASEKFGAGLDLKKSLQEHETKIFEAAMEAVYGKDIWNWINERIE